MQIYRPGNFEVRELSVEEALELKELSRWARRYVLLGVAMIPIAAIMAVQRHWFYALLVWLLSNVSSMIGGYYHQKAKEIGHD